MLFTPCGKATCEKYFSRMAKWSGIVYITGSKPDLDFCILSEANVFLVFVFSQGQTFSRILHTINDKLILEFIRLSRANVF